jgi:hypothetical protein
VLRIFAGRTPSDPYHGEDAIECGCGTSTISFLHLLTECPLLAEARLPILERLPAGITLSPLLAIDPRYTWVFTNFVKSTGLGIRPNLRYSDYPPPSQSSHIDIDPDPDPNQDEEVDDSFHNDDHPDNVPFGAFE